MERHSTKFLTSTPQTVIKIKERQKLSQTKEAKET